MKVFFQVPTELCHHQLRARTVEREQDPAHRLVLRRSDLLGHRPAHAVLDERPGARLDGCVEPVGEVDFLKAEIPR
ncbi:hypothetical protein [Streptomyces vastus]|uniref:Uncharacterized protein n=1 Tax=Streptomyces vastus TaxID=285451 RepID=A0ABP6DPF5_9ACTN